MSPLSRLALGALLVAFSAVSGFPQAAPAQEFHVSPEGKPDGDGSPTRPWDLATALGQPASVTPGSRIRLHAGTYRAPFNSRLTGTAERRIVVEPVDRNAAVIFDCNAPQGKQRLFSVEGAYTDYRDFEVTCSDPQRTVKTAGSFELDRGGITCRGAQIRFINLVVHDVGVGIGHWSDGAGGEISGCIFYNNGWKGPDRGHGHAIYSQNRDGVKRLVDNVMFNQFAYGIHVYGSSKASLRGYEIEGNMAFNNGALSGPDERAPNILIGGGTPASGISLRHNHAYHSGNGTNVRIGSGQANEDLRMTSNRFHGFTHLANWARIEASENHFSAPDSLVTLDLPRAPAPGGYRWERNRYEPATPRYQPLLAHQDGKRLAFGWTEWSQKLDFDKDSKYVEAAQKGTEVFVRSNSHEAGRAHVAIYNWDKAGEVSVDLSKVLKAGQKYRIQSVQDLRGKPLAVGTFTGAPVRISMRPLAPPTPVGMPDFPLPITRPEFDALLVSADPER